MGKRRVRSDVYNGEDKEVGGDMPKRFLRIIKATTNPNPVSAEERAPKPSFDRVRPGESFFEYNSRLANASKPKATEPEVERKQQELYLKPSLMAALGDTGKGISKPIRPKRKEFLQKRKEKKQIQAKVKKQVFEPIVHQSSIPRPLRDVVQEPPKFKPKK